MNTNIAQIKGKWYVVASKVICGTTLWYPVSVAYNTSLEARTEQVEYVMGRKSI